MLRTYQPSNAIENSVSVHVWQLAADVWFLLEEELRVATSLQFLTKRSLTDFSKLKDGYGLAKNRAF